MYTKYKLYINILKPSNLCCSTSLPGNIAVYCTARKYCISKDEHDKIMIGHKDCKQYSNERCNPWSILSSMWVTF